MKGSSTVNNNDLGANEFTFEGDRTKITYLTETPGPIPAGTTGEGRLEYEGPEGDYVFSGDQIIRLDSALGSLVTTILRPNADAGDIKITLLVPKAYGVTRGDPVIFGTLAVKTTSRGFIDTPGVELTYDVLPLVAQAHQVIEPV
jgi:hypothetical protein